MTAKDTMTSEELAELLRVVNLPLKHSLRAFHHEHAEAYDRAFGRGIMGEPSENVVRLIATARAHTANPPTGGEALTLEELTDIFGRTFDGEEDPRVRLAQALTRTEAEAVLEFNGDLTKLTPPPTGGLDREEVADGDMIERLRALLIADDRMHPVGCSTWQQEAEYVIEWAADQIIAKASDSQALAEARGEVERLKAAEAFVRNHAKNDPVFAKGIDKVRIAEARQIVADIDVARAALTDGR